MNTFVNKDDRNSTGKKEWVIGVGHSCGEMSNQGSPVKGPSRKEGCKEYLGLPQEHRLQLGGDVKVKYVMTREGNRKTHVHCDRPSRSIAVILNWGGVPQGN